MLIDWESEIPFVDETQSGSDVYMSIIWTLEVIGRGLTVRGRARDWRNTS